MSTTVDPTQAHVRADRKSASPPICCRFDPQGKFLFAGGEDFSIQRWALDSDQPISFTGHDSWVNALACSSDGQTLVSAGSDGRLVWWPAAADKPDPVRKIDAHRGWVRCLATSPDGQWIASGGNDHAVRLWNLADGAPAKELVGHDSHVYSVVFHPGGEFLLSGDLKGSIKQWRLSDGSLVRSFDAKALHSYNGGQGVDFGGVRTLALSADGKYLAAGGLYKAENPLGAVHEPLVLLFEWESQKLLRSHIAEGVKGVMWRVAFHSESFLVGVSGGSGGGFLLFWKPDADKEFHRFQLPGLARDMDLHPDGVQVATAHFDRTLRLTRLAAKEK